MNRYGWTLLLVAACGLLGVYAEILNQQLYQHQCPFYDSLSYNEQLFRVMTLAHQQGIVAAFCEASFSSSTVCLPFLLAALVAPLVEPSRSVGIWIQTGWLLIFLVSLQSYLTRLRLLHPRFALLVCLTFLMAASLYYDNGGLSDFRMDLGLCLTFGITAVWLLAALEYPTWWRFGLLGLAGAVCCLSRATAPLYLLVALLPVVAMNWNSLPATKLFCSTAIVIVLAGWFYWLNFEYLYFYYAVWNIDANAKIPWSVALAHLKMVQRSIGDPLMLFWGLAGVGCAIQYSRTKKPEDQRERRPTQLPVGNNEHSTTNALTQNQSANISTWIDWRWLWIGLAPVLMLIARRAGLNPFVSMPSIVGLILVVSLPLARWLERAGSVRLERYVWVCLLICLTFSAARGWRRHQQKNKFNTMAAQQEILKQIITDPNERTDGLKRFGVVQMSDINTHAMYSILLFDWPNVNRQLNQVIVGEQRLKRVQIFSLPAQANWDLVTGETDAEKWKALLDEAEQKVDYLIVPDEETATFLQQNYNHNFINRYLPELRAGVLAGPWVKIFSVQVGKNERVEVFRREGD